MKRITLLTCLLCVAELSCRNPEDAYLFQGTVQTLDGGPVPNHEVAYRLVKAFDPRGRSLPPTPGPVLGTVQTDESGAFALELFEAQLQTHAANSQLRIETELDGLTIGAELAWQAEPTVQLLPFGPAQPPMQTSGSAAGGELIRCSVPKVPGHELAPLAIEALWLDTTEQTFWRHTWDVRNDTPGTAKVFLLGEPTFENENSRLIVKALMLHHREVQQLDTSFLGIDTLYTFTQYANLTVPYVNGLVSRGSQCPDYATVCPFTDGLMVESPVHTNGLISFQFDRAIVPQVIVLRGVRAAPQVEFLRLTNDTHRQSVRLSRFKGVGPEGGPGGLDYAAFRVPSDLMPQFQPSTTFTIGFEAVSVMEVSIYE